MLIVSFSPFRNCVSEDSAYTDDATAPLQPAVEMILQLAIAFVAAVPIDRSIAGRPAER
jgi:hypothetical protein